MHIQVKESFIIHKTKKKKKKVMAHMIQEIIDAMFTTV